MKQSQEKPDIETDLLSDEEFAALIQQEFSAGDERVDEIEKQQVWNDIQGDAIKRTKRLTTPWISLAVAAVLVMVFIPLLNINMPVDDGTRIKGSATMLPVYLSAFRLEANGALAPVSQSVTVGDTLVFKLGAVEQLVVGLAVSENDGNARTRFVSDRMSAGMEQLLERDERTYGYVVEKEHNKLLFCAVAGRTTEELESVISMLDQTWNAIPHEACAGFFVNKK